MLRSVNCSILREIYFGGYANQRGRGICSYSWSLLYRTLDKYLGDDIFHLEVCWVKAIVRKRSRLTAGHGLSQSHLKWVCGFISHDTSLPPCIILCGPKPWTCSPKPRIWWPRLSAHVSRIGKPHPRRKDTTNSSGVAPRRDRPLAII